MARVGYRLRVYGRVQGVFYRASMKEVADSLGVDGYVRNMDDGSVEAVVAGDEQAVKKILEWCKRGPPLAHVTRVDVVEINPENVEKGFRIRY